MDAQESLPSLPADTQILDVRELLRAGGEPFDVIIQALEKLKQGQGLAIRATFEPRPLFGLFKARGFKGQSHKLAEEDWLVNFQPEDPSQAPRSIPMPKGPPTSPPKPKQGEGDFDLLDVRGLEPPEPMVRILAHCRELPDGRTLKVVHERRPEFLYPRLDEQGLVHRTEVLDADLVHLYITRPGKRGA
ncbi:MAG: DUF2249 domain-containing protein [bacterium]